MLKTLKSVFECIIEKNWGVPIFVFVLMMRQPADKFYRTFHVSVTDILFLLLILVILLRWRYLKEQPAGWLSAVILVGGYNLVCLISLINAADVNIAVKGALVQLH